MSYKEFIIDLLKIASFDGISIFILYILWKYIDFKYFSSLEITTLKEENAYLKNQNQKFNGSNTFWTDEDFN